MTYPWWYKFRHPVLNGYRRIREATAKDNMRRAARREQ